MAATPPPLEIFVSHSVQDRNIVEAVVTLLRLGCDISENVIFCSSLAGIPNGEYFVKYILNKLSETKVVIAIVSGEYVKSQFCLAEAGAAQLRQHIQGKCKCFILLIPPVQYNDISGVLYGVQAGKINDDDTLGELRDFLHAEIDRRGKERSWTSAKKTFLETLGKILHERDMIRLIYKGIKVHKKEIEKLSPQLEAKRTYRRKYVLILRNETGKPVNLKNAFLECKETDAKPHPQQHWHIFQQFKNDRWEGELQQMTVNVGERFLVKVAFDNSYRHEDLETRALNDELGTIKIVMVIAGVTVWYVKRLYS